MNHKQKIALIAGVINLIVLLLFPPIDSSSSTDARALEFSGFNFVLTLGVNEVVNGNMLFLEVMVLLVNMAIAWLLLQDIKKSAGVKGRINFQNAILLIVAINLTVILLFPPFEYVYAVTKAILPTFQGFYFIFAAGPMLTIVTPLLYLEVMFVLFNGAIFWFLFNREDAYDSAHRK